MLDQEIRPVTALNRDGLVQMVEHVDQKHEEAHKRLRLDLRQLEEEVNKGFQSLRESSLTNRAKITEIEKMPVDATKLVLSTPVIVAMIVMALGIAAAMWSVRSGMERLSDKMEAASKLSDVQNGALKTSVDDMKRRQELQQYEIQSLKEAILTANPAKLK